MAKIVTLLTDFGTTDYYVGAMKGALLAVAPEAHIIDITHEIPPQDVEAGAWMLAQACAMFPSGTVHVAVVDPEVGTARRAIAVRADSHIFIAPDNGLLTHTLASTQINEIVALTNRRFFRSTVSPTFHGRDVFAPVAGAILNDVRLSELGDLLTNYVRLSLPLVERMPDGTFVATIIHVDRFGNLITNITPDDWQSDGISLSAVLGVAKRRIIAPVCETFGAGAAGEILLVWGSAGRLEVVARKSSAARALGVGRGARITLARVC